MKSSDLSDAVVFRLEAELLYCEMTEVLLCIINRDRHNLTFILWLIRKFGSRRHS